MANNVITLFCLRDGYTPENTFPIDIEASKTVAHLKKLIKKENSSLVEVDASRLILWSVSLQPTPENDDFPVDLNSVVGRKKLRPLEILSSVFLGELAKDSIHVIFEVRFEVPILVNTANVSAAVPGSALEAGQKEVEKYYDSDLVWALLAYCVVQSIAIATAFGVFVWMEKASGSSDFAALVAGIFIAAPALSTASKGIKWWNIMYRTRVSERQKRFSKRKATLKVSEKQMPDSDSGEHTE